MKTAITIVSMLLLAACVAKIPVQPPTPSPLPTMEMQTAVDPRDSMLVSFNVKCPQCVSYHWSFGDGMGHLTQSPVQSYHYTGPGTYTVTVAGTDKGGKVFYAQAQLVVSVQDTMTLEIGVNGGKAPLHTSFYAKCATCTQYSWDFGDGTATSGLSNMKLVAHVFTKAGHYTVLVKSVNAAGQLQLQSAEITVFAAVTTSDNRYCLAGNNWNGGKQDGPALLPERCFFTDSSGTPSPGSVVNVPVQETLQQAYDAAVCGQTLVLPGGATVYSGPTAFTAKNCDDQHWITIMSAGVLPPEGTRLNPNVFPVATMATIEMTGGQPPNRITGDHLRFVGIWFRKKVGSRMLSVLVDTSNANKVIFDRDYFSGDNGEALRGIYLGSGKYVAVLDSYFEKFACIAITGACGDSQAIAGGTGPGQLTAGPYKIVNNFLEAAAENILFGGGAADGCPTDIEIRRNHFYKPMTWNPADPSYAKVAYIVKNLFELKNACRVFLEGNIFENSWGGYSQAGWAISIGPKNQAGPNHTSICPLCTITDVTFRYNLIRHAAGAFAIFNTVGDNGGWSAGGGRYSFHDVIGDALQYVNCFRCGRNLNEIASDYISTNPPPSSEIMHDVVFNHLTLVANKFIASGIQSNALMELSGPPKVNAAKVQQMQNIVFNNSIVATGGNGTYPTGGGKDNCAVLPTSVQPRDEIAACWAGKSSFAGNLLVTPVGVTSQSWPAGNTISSGWTGVGFMNFNNGDGGDYHLVKPVGWGANVDQVMNATKGVQ